MKITTILFSIISILVFTSCSNKDYNLFQNHDDENFDDNITSISSIDYRNEKNYEYKIAVNDRLSVSIYLESKIGSPQMDLILNSKGMNIDIDQQENIGLLVAANGTVRLPLLGPVSLIGFTQDEASEFLIKKYKKYIKKPYVRVQIKNQKVIVMGEVKNPGIINIPNGTTNLIEVLARSGDFTELAEKTRIRVIRGDLRDPEIRIIDLTDTKNLFTSSLLLRPNDIVYVQSREIDGINKLIKDLNPFFTTLSFMLNPLVQRKIILGGDEN